MFVRFCLDNVFNDRFDRREVLVFQRFWNLRKCNVQRKAPSSQFAVTINIWVRYNSVDFKMYKENCCASANGNMTVKSMSGSKNGIENKRLKGD